MDEPASPLTPSPEHPSSADATNPGRTRHINEVSWWRYLLLLPLSLVARLWCATLRFKVTELERAAITLQGGPVVIAMWHNRLFVAGEYHRRYWAGRRLVSLVSASKDGAWLAAYFKLVDIEAARGSSSWRGMQALRELLAARQSGADLGITPDGPRGPCYEIKPGVLLLARHAKTPLLLASAHFTSAWRMKSWDGFYVPKPFSVVEVHARLLPNYASLGTDDESAAREMHRRMMELSPDV